MSDETQSKESERTSKREGDAPANGEAKKDVASAVPQESAEPGDEGAVEKGEASTSERDDEGDEGADQDDDEKDAAPKTTATKDEAPDSKKSDDESPLLVKGNPLRRWRGGATMGGAAFLAKPLSIERGGNPNS